MQTFNPKTCLGSSPCFDKGGREIQARGSYTVAASLCYRLKVGCHLPVSRSEHTHTAELACSITQLWLYTLKLIIHWELHTYVEEIKGEVTAFEIKKTVNSHL